MDLLQDNPDWRWFILFASVSLVITGVTWFISKCIPVSIVVLDYMIAETDTHSVANGSWQSDRRIESVLAQKKRQGRFKFFSMISKSFPVSQSTCTMIIHKLQLLG